MSQFMRLAAQLDALESAHELGQHGDAPEDRWALADLEAKVVATPSLSADSLAWRLGRLRRDIWREYDPAEIAPLLAAIERDVLALASA